MSLFLIFFKWMKYFHQHRAYDAFRNQLLHDSLSKGIYVKNVDERILEISQFLQEQKVKKFQDSVIFRRVRRTLKHLKAIPKKEEITSILRSSVAVGDYLNQQQISLLKQRGFDISNLNPGVSALWAPVTEEKIRKVVTVNSDYFPPEGLTLSYKSVILRGHQSPKLKVFYYKGDKKI